MWKLLPEQVGKWKEAKVFSGCLVGFALYIPGLVDASKKPSCWVTNLVSVNDFCL